MAVIARGVSDEKGTKRIGRTDCQAALKKAETMPGSPLWVEVVSHPRVR